MPSYRFVRRATSFGSTLEWYVARELRRRLGCDVATGVKFRVVTFPSTVMANVVKRNGRLRMWERLLRRDLFLVTRNGTLGSLRYFTPLR